MHVRYFFLPRLVSLDQSNCSKFMSIQILKNTLHGKTFAENQFNTVITARKRSCRKIMFLHLSLILFTGGGVSVQQGVSVWGGICVRSVKNGRYASYWNAFMILVVENVAIKV